MPLSNNLTFCPLFASALPARRKRYETSSFRANPHIAGHMPSVLTQISLVAKLTKAYHSNVGDILGITVWIIHMTLEDLEIDELMLAPRRHIACGDGQGFSEGNSWLKAPNTKHTAISLATLLISIHSATATIGTLTLVNSQAPWAKHALFGQHPFSRDTKHIGCPAQPQTRLTRKARETLDVCFVDRLPRLLKIWKRVSTNVHQ